MCKGQGAVLSASQLTTIVCDAKFGIVKCRHERVCGWVQTVLFFDLDLCSVYDGCEEGLVHSMIHYVRDELLHTS